MKNTFRFIGFTIFILVIGFITVACSEIEEKPNTPQINQSYGSALRAAPVAASNNINEPQILDFFGEGEVNWYIIDAGYIRNAFVMQMGPFEYQGFGTVALSINVIRLVTITRTGRSNVFWLCWKSCTLLK